MPAQKPPSQPARWPARISHYTSYEQLATLEGVRSEARADGGAAVPVAALLRAAADICLTDLQLRTRLIDLARSDWR